MDITAGAGKKTNLPLTNNMPETLLEMSVAKLPATWTYLDGLTFPMSMVIAGKGRVFAGYEEYHNFISWAFSDHHLPSYNQARI